MAEETIEQAHPGPRARAILALQIALVAVVVFGALDLHLRLQWPLDDDQFSMVVLGIAIALCFLIVPASARLRGSVRWWDVLAAAVGLAVCLYLAWRLPVLAHEAALRPLDAVLCSAALCLLVLEGARRTAGLLLVGAIAAGVVYAMLGHHLSGALQARPIEFTRLLVYLGLDTNALLGPT